MSQTGQMNMVIDHWLLEQHRQGLQSSVLRFYTWTPAAISLGYHQRRWPHEWMQIPWQGRCLDVVRRPTGGRAVLHQGDLTYALVTSGLNCDRTTSYRYLCQFLIEGLGALGMPLSFGAMGRSYIHNPNCFGTTTGADLIASTGGKVIGSAQLWRDGCVLQHGSIRLWTDPDLYHQVFGSKLLPMELPPTLTQLTPEALQTKLIDALKSAAQACFSSPLEPQPLTSRELKSLVELTELECNKPYRGG